MIKRALQAFMLTGLFVLSASEPEAIPWGAAAARSDESLTVERMLRYAIEDEYLARAEYSLIISRYGSIKPFSNIVKSEETHIAWLREEYRARNIPVPLDRGAEYAVLPSSVEEALRVGVRAEVDNIAMYDRFLTEKETLKHGNESLVSLFTRLRDASKNHLQAFKKGLE